MAKGRKSKVDELLDSLLEGKKPEEVLGQEGLLGELTKRLVERALEGEMTAHLGYPKHAAGGRNGQNSRNGRVAKRVKTDSSEVEIEVPRDREGTFEPRLVPKRRRRLAGFDDKVLSLYARGMSTREIQGHLKELYGVAVSPSLISAVTDAVLDDVRAWQERPLDPFWVGDSEGEGARFWLSVLTEMKNRGVEDFLIAAVDGLKGFPEAIAAVYPRSQVQLCIVHMARNSLRYVSWKHQKGVARDLRKLAPAVGRS
jgi:putative transposase